MIQSEKTTKKTKEVLEKFGITKREAGYRQLFNALRLVKEEPFYFCEIKNGEEVPMYAKFSEEEIIHMQESISKSLETKEGKRKLGYFKEIFKRDPKPHEFVVILSHYF